MLAIASEWGWEIAVIRLDWQQLQAAIVQNDVLLVLQNSNVVTAVEDTRGSREEILISDPLHQNGKPFLLPRGVLERAWQGDALIVKRNLQSSRYFTVKNTVVFLLASLAAIAIAAYPAIKENVPGSAQTTHYESSSETTTKNISLADSLDLSPNRATPFSMALAGKTTLSPSVVEQIQSSGPPADDTRVPVGDDSLEQPAGVSKVSEQTPEVVSPVAPPAATAGAAMGAELEDLPMVVPLDTRLVVQAAKAAPMNDSPSAPDKPDRVPQKTHPEDSDLLYQRR